MTDAMTMNGFCELSDNEMVMVDGGWNWGLVLGGAGLVVACIGVAAAAPVSFPVLGAAALCGFSALGGSAMGNGFIS